MSDEPNFLSLFKAAMAGTGFSLNGINQALNRTAEQTAQAQQMTGLALEQIYKANLKLESYLKVTETGKIKIAFTLGNFSPFPVTSAKGVLSIEHPKMEVNYTEEASIIDENKFETHKAENIFSTAIDLQPRMAYEQTIELKIEKAIQCNGTIEISIANLANPSTPILIKHEFGLYLIDQLTRNTINNAKRKALDIKKTEKYPFRFVREIMNIHPAKGIEIGMKCEFSDPQNIITSEIIQVSLDNNSVTIEFCSNDDHFLTMFITELNRLN